MAAGKRRRRQHRYGTPDSKHFRFKYSSLSLAFCTITMIILVQVVGITLFGNTLFGVSFLPDFYYSEPQSKQLLCSISSPKSPSTNSEALTTAASTPITIKKRSPWVSYPLMTNTTTQCKSWQVTTRNAPRFFLGGGKAGSTALWQLLLNGTPWSGHGPNSSDFIGLAQEFPDRPHERGSGKEMCFGKRSRDTLEMYNSLFEESSKISNVGLDCCPQGTEKIRICNLWKIFPCEIKFVMIVRDHSDHALSWFNDKSSSGQHDSSMVDKWTLKKAQNDRNFQYNQVLRDALDCGVDSRAILVVDSDGLKISPEMLQLTMDAIFEHYGLPRMRHSPITANQAKEGSKRHMMAKTKPETVVLIRKSMEKVTREFLGMLETPDGILQKSLDFLKKID